MPRLPRALRRSLAGTGLLAVPVSLVVLLASVAFGAVGQQLAMNMLIAMVAVVGMGIYSGNSGIISFGHAAFVGIAAYVTGLLTAPAAIKQQTLPDLPDFLMQLELPLHASMAMAVAVVVLVALLVGIPFSRLSAGATPIATFTMMLMVYIVLVGAKQFTRGSETFYGVPPSSTLLIASLAVLLAMFLARMFKESVVGLRLQATREDDLAAASMGINVAWVRLLAWLTSAAIVAVAGVLMAHELTAFSPKQFYITLQFTLVAMLVVGGQTTVTGAVVGTVVVSAMLEAARRLEITLNGLQIGSVTIDNVFGLQEITLGLLIFSVMIWRRDGLFAFTEVDERILARVKSRKDQQIGAP